MKLAATAREEAFGREVRAFAEAELDPLTRERVLEDLPLSKADHVGWHRKLAARGWSCPHWPVEHGGTGWTPMRRFVFERETSEAGAPDRIPFGPDMVAPVLWTYGDEAQRERHLPGILAGEVWWCQGYSEPEAGSDLAALRTQAARDGDGYVVNGIKTWTTLAHWADWMFCLARTGGGGRKQEGISFLLIDMASPGVSVHPIVTMEGGHEVNQVVLDDVRVPLANRVGEEGRGWTYAKFLLGHERTGMAGVPRARRRLARLRRIAAEAGLLDDAGFRRRLAAVEIEILALESTMLKLLAAEERGRTPGFEASHIKIRGTEIDQLLTELAMEATGPYVAAAPRPPEPGRNEAPIGPARAAAVAPAYFNTRKVTIYAGSNEIQRNIIARRVLGL